MSEERKKEIEKNQKLQELEQSMAFIGGSMPAVWRRMFENLIEEGFTADQAFELVKTSIHGMSGGKQQ